MKVYLIEDIMKDVHFIFILLTDTDLTGVDISISNYLLNSI